MRTTSPGLQVEGARPDLQLAVSLEQHVERAPCVRVLVRHVHRGRAAQQAVLVERRLDAGEAEQVTDGIHVRLSGER